MPGPKSPNTPNSSAESADSGEKTQVLKGDQETLNREIQKLRDQDACLIVIRGPRQGFRYFVTHPDMAIGRDATAEISISDPSISRKHAKVLKTPNGIQLTDLGSANGTVINGAKIGANETVTLAKEDMIKLGNTILKFLPAGELEILVYGHLSTAAHTDPLTKIYNKGYLDEALEAECKRARALHTELSLLFLDLDHFKKINDTYGHDAGDFVLREFTQLVRPLLPKPKDVFARFGGEEFVILLSHTSLQAAQSFAESLRAAIQAHQFVYEGKRIQVTASFGVAEMTATISTPQSLIKHADQALYRSKQEGRNRVTIAT